jgi:D-alanyl-D-alanine dipeptidase
MATQQDDERQYWSQQLEAAWRFMFESILPYPVAECGEALVDLRAAGRAAGVEVYFSDQPHVRGLPRVFCLREGQIDGFVGAAREMNARGWALRVEDGFRSREMQKYLGRAPAVFDAILEKVMWELGGERPSPEFMFRRCSALVATVPKFGTHMSGSAIDLSVVLRDAPDTEVDRGAPYLDMSARTPMDSPYVSAQARQHRREITALMGRHGFVAYPWEFWHYSSGDAYDQFLRQTGRPAIYGPVDWDASSGRLTPMHNATQALNSDEEIRDEIAAALRRRAEQRGWA